MADVTVLDVRLYGMPIGTLTRVGGDRTIFAFDDDYVKDALGQLITDVKPTRVRVPPFFSNLLPEGPLRDYLAERAGVHPSREFFLLWVLGSDLPGATTVVPADGEPWPLDAQGEGDAGGRDPRGNALRFSLAGVQLKFSAIHNARGGLTIPAKGVGGSWIVKLPSREFRRVPENEYSMLTLARLVGMDVPAVEL